VRWRGRPLITLRIERPVGVPFLSGHCPYPALRFSFSGPWALGRWAATHPYRPHRGGRKPKSRRSHQVKPLIASAPDQPLGDIAVGLRAFLFGIVSSGVGHSCPFRPSGRLRLSDQLRYTDELTLPPRLVA